MKTVFYSMLMLISILFSSCIGDDFLEDFVEPTVQITNPLDTIGLGEDYQFTARFLNNVGMEEVLSKTWISSDDAIVTIDNQGNANALQTGEVTIEVRAEYKDTTYSDELVLIVGEETVITETERTGTLRTTSSYALTGDFSMKEEGTTLTLDFASDYQASTALPGLYVYLTNNPNSIVNAFEIGRVEVFNGAHTYTIEGVGLNEYQYVLYYCKPFNVKVGDGEFEN